MLKTRFQKEIKHIDTMDNPKISVIVPVYTVELYIRKCIESILHQSFSDFELILVDDGSTDESGRICDEYAEKDSRIKVIHKANEGVSIARNTGIDNASGHLITFIDSDDWVEEAYLQTIFDEIGSSDILFFGSVWHYEDGCIRSMSFKNSVYEKDIEQGMLALLKNNIDINYLGFTWNKAFRKDIIDRYHIRFVERLSFSEDEVFTLDYCKHVKTLKIIEAPLYHYLWKDNGLTQAKKKKADYLLLIDSLEGAIIPLKNEELYSYYRERIAILYTLVAWASNNPIKNILGELKVFAYCCKHKVRIPIATTARVLLNKIKNHD